MDAKEVNQLASPAHLKNIFFSLEKNLGQSFYPIFTSNVVFYIISELRGTV